MTECQLPYEHLSPLQAAVGVVDKVFPLVFTKVMNALLTSYHMHGFLELVKLVELRGCGLILGIVCGYKIACANGMALVF